VVSTLAQSYLHASGHSAAGAAELAVSRKKAKYSCLPQSFLFVPIALETLGAIALCCLDFLTEVGRRLSAATGDARKMAFLFQRISVALQRSNAVLIHESFVAPDVEPDLYPFQHVFLASSPWLFYTIGQKIIIIRFVERRSVVFAILIRPMSHVWLFNGFILLIGFCFSFFIITLLSCVLSAFQFPPIISSHLMSSILS